MKARQIVKTIEIEEREQIPVPPNTDPKAVPIKPEYKVLSCRRFKIQKYPAIDGLKVAKVFVAKILPVFQSFIPLIGEAGKVKSGEGRSALDNMLSNLGQYLSMDSIADTLDKVASEDLDYIMQISLQNVFEVLPAGDAQVLNSDGTYGVADVEYDAMLVLRLVCEVVMWSVGDFFNGNRWASIMSPLSSSLSRSRKT